MLILRPSSPLHLIEIKREELETGGDGSSDPGAPYIDEGLPIPYSYDTDIVRALMQDPFRILIYWEIREATLESLKRYFSPEDLASFKVVLRLIDIASQNEAFFETSRQGRYWMSVFPEREYEFEIGVRSPVHGYIAFVRSNRVRTPRGAVSSEKADEDEYRMAPPLFMQVIEASGFSPSHAMNITAAGTAMAPDKLIEAAISGLPEPVRAAVAAATSGEPLSRELLERLPEPLRSELLKVLKTGGGLMASVALMNYFPELVREAIEAEQDLIGAGIDPLYGALYVAPRFIGGSSESQSRPGGEFRWSGFPRLPSSPTPSRRDGRGK